ncbi:MAG: Ldh family oxidoreductase [Chthoniobacterales bacterium]|nr:Ldh family oxidoreductase [Chthoniobacterales bacterium]
MAKTVTKQSGSSPLHRPVYAEELKAFLLAAMRQCGVRRADAEVTAEVLVTTDTWGTFTHGSKQLLPLLQLHPDRMDLAARPEVLAEGAGWALVDGHYALATVTSCHAMQLAIRKARTAGVAFVGVRNSNHFGGAGYYAHLAAQKNMIGLAMTNTNPLMAVPGAASMVLGTNPFSYAVPAGREKPVFLDIATSVVAASKAISAKALGQTVPLGWLVDKQGLPTTDPSRYPEEGALLPMAGHKGYGLALMIEILCATLTGADMLSGVKLWLEKHPGPLNQGHAFIAINISKFMPLKRFKERMDRMIREIKSAPKAKGSKRIYLPGEIEWDNRERALRQGMILPEHVIERLAGLAADFGLELDKFFPKKKRAVKR